MVAASYGYNVFINCPFDDPYRPLFEALVFAVHDCGYIARCAMEVDDASEVRIEKIAKIIRDCKFGIHDICRTEPDPLTGLPRFNMPLELGQPQVLLPSRGAAPNCLMLWRDVSDPAVT